MRILSGLALALAMAVGAPVAGQADSAQSVLSATAHTHRQHLSGAGDSWHVVSRTIGGEFVLQARRAASGWEISSAGRPASQAEHSLIGPVGQMMQGSLQMLVALDEMLWVEDAFRLAGRDSAAGAPAMLFELNQQSEVGIAFMEGMRRGAGNLDAMWVMVDPARRVVTGLRMSGDIAGNGNPAARVLVEFIDYQRRGPVTLPTRLRFVMDGVMPAMTADERKEAESSLAAGREALKEMSEAERAQVEPYIRMMSDMLRHNRMVVESLVVEVRAGTAP
jgi:hypothetical protein